MNTRYQRKNALAVGTDDETDISALTAEGRLIVELITSRIEKMQNEFERRMEEKSDQVAKLESQVDVLLTKVDKLEARVDDADAYERRDTIIVSGPDIPVCTVGENCINLVTMLIKDKLQLNISPSDISTAHRLGKKPIQQQQDRRSLIVKLCRRDLKNDLKFACKEKKPNLYINEDLTPIRKTIMFVLRAAKRKFPDKVSGCSSVDGKVFVWTKPPNPDIPGSRDLRISVNTRHSLEKFCTRDLSVPVSEFIDNWPH